MSAPTTAGLSRRVAEPFRSDPDFWRSVCASADAVVLLAVAVAGAAALRFAGVGATLTWLPFALPAFFLVRAAVSGKRFRRRHEPLPAMVDTPQGEQSWRDAERAAVTAVFGRALLRNRRSLT